MAGEFKKLIMSIELTEDDRKYFINVCADWEGYCTMLSTAKKYKIMQLLKYFTTERLNSHRMLDRCIGRFNRLNALSKGELQ